MKILGLMVSGIWLLACTSDGDTEWGEATGAVTADDTDPMPQVPPPGPGPGGPPLPLPANQCSSQSIGYCAYSTLNGPCLDANFVAIPGTTCASFVQPPNFHNLPLNLPWSWPGWDCNLCLGLPPFPPPPPVVPVPVPPPPPEEIAAE